MKTFALFLKIALTGTGSQVQGIPKSNAMNLSQWPPLTSSSKTYLFWRM